MSQPLRTAEWCLLILLSALWGGSFFFYKVLVAVLPPRTVVLGRVGVAALILNAWLLARGDPMPRSRRLWARFLVMGLLNNVIPFSLIAFGEVRITSGLASILNATTPIFTVIAAHGLTENEKATAGRLLGVLFGFAGTAVLVGPAAMRGLGSGSLLGESACLLAAISYAFAGIYGRRFSEIAPLKVATGQITASTIVLLPLAAAVDRPWTLPLPGIAVWLSILGIALLCTALAYVVYFRLLAAAGAINLLLVTFLLPVSSLLLGWFVLGETVAPSAFGGMALIGLGLAAIDGRGPSHLAAAAGRPGPATIVSALVGLSCWFMVRRQRGAAAMAGGTWTTPKLMVPAYGGRLEPLPTTRRRAFASHLRKIIAEAFAEPAPRVRETPSNTVPPAATQAACATCRGQCCSHGGEHAYLDEDTIRRVVRARPGLGARGIAALYRARLAKESFAGSCVFHGAQGCRLPRELRSDLCNDFYCNALKVFLRDHGKAIPPRLRIVAKSAEGVQRCELVEFPRS